MHLLATRAFTYGDRPLKPGDRFQASAEDARKLIGWDKAIDDPNPDLLQSRAMSTTSAEPLVPSPSRKGSRYRRTDMRSED